MNRRHGALVTAIELAAYGVAVWYSLPPSVRRDTTISAWYHMAAAARGSATALGILAIRAESRYYREVSP